MSPSRILPLVLASGFVLGLAPASQAAHGVVDLSWGTCSPVVSSITDPASGPLSLIASQLGNDRIHKAYQVVFHLTAIDGIVPDAWRFDAAGCGSTSRITFNSSPPPALAKACPQFKGPNSLMLSNYGPWPVSSETLMRGLMAVTYSPAPTSLATQRSFLAEFVFDHSRANAGTSRPGEGVRHGGRLRPPSRTTRPFPPMKESPWAIRAYGSRSRFSPSPSYFRSALRPSRPTRPTA